MSKEQENSKETKTPTLYTFYGKQYDFNDLRRDSDLGFKDYLKTLRRGDKDSEELWNAYSNIMSGIGDGSITFENGRFNDSLGRYSNGVYYDNDGKKQTSKKKSRDYYGLVANYIAGKLGRSQEYQEPKEPEDKTRIKWSGNNSLGLAFNRRMFNTDNGNIMDFIDLDPYDEGTKSRKTDNRIKQVKDVTKYLYDNFESLFTGYSDTDSQQAKQYLKEAMTSLDDNTVNSGDYLALSRAFGGIDWRNMFNTQQSTLQQTGEVQSDQTQLTPTQKFASWVEQKYPKYTGNLKKRLLSIGTTYTDFEKNSLQNALQGLQTGDLQRMIRSIITDPTYKFNNESFISNTFQGTPTWFANQYGLSSILQTLKNKNFLKPLSKENPNLYYIPGTTTKDNIGWVWDDTNNTIQQMDIRSIPYWQQRMLQEYKGETGGDLAWATPYLKDGGIIKAERGVQLNSNANWYSGVFTPQIDYIITSLKNDSNYYKWLNNMQDKHSSLYKSAGSDFANKAYESDLVGEYQNLYKSGYNNEWGDDNLGYNSLGILNAQLNGMFNIGKNGISGDRPGQWKTDNLYSSITDYRRLLGRKGDYTDDQLSEVTQKFKDVGYSFDLGDDGYYRLNPLLDKIERPISSVAVKPDIPQRISIPKVEPGTLGTQVNPVEEQKKQTRNFNWNVSPDLIGAGRLVSSIVTNNRVTDTIMKSLKPVLKDTYERHSPITGALGEMQFRNNQASNLRGQVARPFTSDASLQLAGHLDADRQARDLEYQGFLADNNEIKRTREAALARQEDNMARRSEVANFNRASINQTGREKAQLQATNLKKNWESVDNFLQGIEGRLRTKRLEDTERRNNFRLQTSVSNIDSKYQDLTKQATNDVSAWMASNPGKALSSMPNYTNYTNYISDMQKWRQAQQYKAHADVYGYDYDNDWLHKTPESIGQPYGYKRGGSLKPSTMYLINKVIKNESNT